MSKEKKRDLIDILEVFVVSYILSYIWETWQVVFFTPSFGVDSPQALPFLPLHASQIWVVATWSLTDATVITFVYSIIKLLCAKEKSTNPKWNLLFLVTFSIALSIIGERIGSYFGWWEYSELMPTIFGVAIVPVLAFIVVPILVIYIVKYIRKNKDASISCCFGISSNEQGCKLKNEV